MTTTQKIHQQIAVLPEELLEEVLDFIEFIQMKTCTRPYRTVRKNTKKTLRPEVEHALQEAEAEWERGDVKVCASPEEALRFLDELTA